MAAVAAVSMGAKAWVNEDGVVFKKPRGDFEELRICNIRDRFRVVKPQAFLRRVPRANLPVPGPDVIGKCEQGQIVIPWAANRSWVVIRATPEMKEQGKAKEFLFITRSSLEPFYLPPE